MTDKVKQNPVASTAALDEPAPMVTPSPTFYSELANSLLTALDQFTAAVPNFDNPTVSKDYIKKKRRVPALLVTNAVSAVLVHSELHSVKALNAEQTIDDKQYIDAFTPLARHMETALKAIIFGIEAREARLAANAQQIYAVAKAFVRDRESTTLAVHVDNMKRAIKAARRGKRASAEVEEPAGKEDATTSASSKQ
ncbi:MAG TPA: hypothetical protein VE974_06395 [Thermoanaerobaculia bacterium]|nr:hypothetical protein [Thermoanaerobaculia bacterium]